jgi:hypothetical protein
MSNNGGVQMTDKTLTIRTADLADAGALARLAALDSSPAPTGATLIAEVGEEVWAAVEIGSGAAVADPFRPSADVVELLRHRALGVRGHATGERRSLARLLPRAA